MHPRQCRYNIDSEVDSASLTGIVHVEGSQKYRKCIHVLYHECRCSMEQLCIVKVVNLQHMHANSYLAIAVIDIVIVHITNIAMYVLVHEVHGSCTERMRRCYFSQVSV